MLRKWLEKHEVVRVSFIARMRCASAAWKHRNEEDEGFDWWARLVSGGKKAIGQRVVRQF